MDASTYTGLITSEHREKPKFKVLVAMVAGSFADITNAAASLNEAFDLDTAIGAQLDAIGLWIGLSRKVLVPISGVYFSFDTAGLGWEQGSWKGPYDPDSGITSLDDETYRTMLRAKIAANHWDGTLGHYRQIMLQAFGSFGVTVVPVDNQDMTMDVYFFGGVMPAVVISLLENGYLLMKAAAVRINGYHVNPVFGFDHSDVYFAGFDTGYWNFY